MSIGIILYVLKVVSVIVTTWVLGILASLLANYIEAKHPSWPHARILRYFSKVMSTLTDYAVKKPMGLIYNLLPDSVKRIVDRIIKS